MVVTRKFGGRYASHVGLSLNQVQFGRNILQKKSISKLASSAIIEMQKVPLRLPVPPISAFYNSQNKYRHKAVSGHT